MAQIGFLGLAGRGDHAKDALAHRQRLAGEEQNAGQGQPMAYRDLAEVVVLREDDAADLDGLASDVQIVFGEETGWKSRQIMPGLDKALCNGAVDAFIDQQLQRYSAAWWIFWPRMSAA
jgi:hypothetical protein